MTTTQTALALPTDAPAADPALVASIDIGTNSIRMSLVRLDPATASWTVVGQNKETVRLGQDGFADRRIEEGAMERGLQVLARLVAIARGRGASEIIAIATAALREAENRDLFVARARDEVGVEVRVVPGMEEARLIHLGVVSGIELGGRRGLFIDIGGGSTEIIVGSQTETFLLDSLKLGAIRVGNRFLAGVTGPIPPALYETMRQHVRTVAAHIFAAVDDAGGFDVAVASSGTAMNLASVAARRAGLELDTVRNYTLKAADLADTAAMLCKLTLEERRRVPGLNPERADIIISGAAVLQTLVEEFGVGSLQISDRSLREGVLVDALARHGGSPDLSGAQYEAGVRRRSVDRLGALVASEARHVQHMTGLALSLFDQARALGLHDGDSHARELFEYAARLHDVGVFVSHTAHHRHSYYLIRHSELAGFTDEEIQIIANLAYFHRKSAPRKRHTHFQLLSRDNQRLVRRLSVLLRLAEGMDRSHLSLVEGATLAVVGKREATLTLHAAAPPPLEIWYLNAEAPVFAEEFGLPLTVTTAPVTAVPGV